MHFLCTASNNSFVETYGSSCLGSRAGRFAFGGLGGSEVAVQRRVGGVENEMAIVAFGKMTLDLALDRRGQLSL